MQVYLNSDLKDEQLQSLRQISNDYFPSFRFPANRTVCLAEHKLVFQMESNMNICEIVLPRSDYHLNVFINSVFSTLLLYITGTLKSMPVRLCNTSGFKIVFYAAANCPASFNSYWSSKITSLDFLRSDENLTETVFSTKLPIPHTEFILYLYLDNLYQAIHNPKFTYSQNIQSNVNTPNSITTNNVNTPSNFASNNVNTPNTFGTNNVNTPSGFTNNVNTPSGFTNNVNNPNTYTFGTNNLNTTNTPNFGSNNVNNPNTLTFGNNLNSANTFATNNMNTQTFSGFGNNLNTPTFSNFGNVSALTTNPVSNNSLTTATNGQTNTFASLFANMSDNTNGFQFTSPRFNEYKL